MEKLIGSPDFDSLSNSRSASPQDEWEEQEEEQEDALFPFSQRIGLKEHTKVISALGLDPSGARILSGSHDYDAKLWDFGGMTMQPRSFKSWEPAGTCYVLPSLSLYYCSLLNILQINDVKFSNDGKRFLVISGTTQAKLYDRDGEEQYVF